MTEEEWHASHDPDDLLEVARAMKRLKARKARLFCCGCYRLVWNQITRHDTRTAIEKSEERADGTISQQDLERFRYPMTYPHDNLATWLAVSVQSLAISNLNPAYIAWQVRLSTDNEVYRQARRGLPCPAQAALVREIAGNPFRPPNWDSRWRTSDAIGLARAIYEDRAFDRLPILADALMDAGCADEQILVHCRGPGPHVRGCWVVDLVLGKE